MSYHRCGSQDNGLPSPLSLTTPTPRPHSQLHQCAVCYKCFDRKDTLKRHIQVHTHPRRALTSRKRSCENCIRSKIRCKGEKPLCSSCVRRNLDCVYPSLYVQQVVNLQPPDENPSIISINDAETFQISSHQNEIAASVDIWKGLYAAGTSSLPYSGNEFDLNLDWIFDPETDQTSQSICVQNLAESQFLAAHQPSLDNAIHSRHLLHDSASLSLPVPVAQERYSQDEPMGGHAAPLSAFSLPPLGTSSPSHEYASFFMSKPVGNSTRELMQSWLQFPLEQKMWNNVSLAAFPEKRELDHCVDMFFAHWDLHCPFVHRPTFDPAREPVVTLAMATLGACYTNFEGRHAFANALSELVRRLLVFMSEHDPRFVRTEHYVSAQILQSAHAFTCGNRRLFELAELSRAMVVNHGRRMGLFSPRKSSCLPTASLEERWHAWIRDERFRRLGWAIYGYDASSSYLFNTKPHISLSEADMDLQISTRHWEAPSEHAWSALHPWTSTPTNRRFRPLLHPFFEDPVAAQAGLDDDHHRLPVILTIMRTLWTVTELEGNPISDFFQAEHNHAHNRALLLHILNQFLISPKSATALLTSQTMIGVIHRLQTIHMAHILCGGAYTDWLYPLLRGGPESESAQGRMKKWAAANPARVRDQAFHCAQVLGLTREYPFNIPQEAFNAYHAGVLLWCLSSLLAGTPDVLQASNPCICRLDYLGEQDGPQLAMVQNWIRHGHRCTLSLHGIPDLLSDEGQQQLLQQVAKTLRGMQVWGIAQNFLRVILRLARKKSHFTAQNLAAYRVDSLG